MARGGSKSPATLVAALDVGGTRIKAGLWDRSGKCVAQDSIPTKRDEGPVSVTSRVLDVSEALVGRADDLGQQVVAIGLAVAGIVDESKGLAVRSLNLGWDQVPLRQLLQERTGLPVAMIHDVRSGALAEATVGAGRAVRDFLFITVGTGVGGALFLNGEVYRGSEGVAGELGHVVVDPQGPQCACGRSGCLEAIVSVPAIERRYRELSGIAIPVERIIDRSAEGDQIAHEVWAFTIEALAATISDYVTVLDPALVVIGGGLPVVGKRFFDPLRRSLRQPSFRTAPPLRAAALGAQAGAIGAALAAWLEYGVSRNELATGRWRARVRQSTEVERTRKVQVATLGVSRQPGPRR